MIGSEQQEQSCKGASENSGIWNVRRMNLEKADNVQTVIYL